MAYTWLTFLAARQQLAARLADPAQAQWTDAEAALYVCESLRMWNSLTSTWLQEFVFNGGGWYQVETMAGSPRAYTQTDVQAYTLLEYNLLEPPSGGTWTGTSQFQLSDLSAALENRRDEMVMAANWGPMLGTLPSRPGTRRALLPDTVLELQRVRWLPAVGPPVTLVRDDRLAFEYFDAEFYRDSPATPSAWMVAAEPPLAFDVDVAPDAPGTWEILYLSSGAKFAPPVPTLLGIPDDFAWVARLGALADLLGRESEATDRQRAAYCLKRYQDGLKLFTATPWVTLANLAGVPLDVANMTDMDRYHPEWDSDPNFADALVVAGGGLFWVPAGSVGLQVLGNAPVPVLDGDFVQVSRSGWDAVLNMAQVMAVFKLGGAEFQSVLGLEQDFLQAAIAENSRLSKLGLFSDVLAGRATSEDRMQERYGQS